MTREERISLYANLCAEGKISSLFNQPWWLEANGPWDVALGMRNDQLVGAMPFALEKRWGISAVCMPVFTHHLQMWMDKPPEVSDHKWQSREKEIIGSIIEHLPDYGYFSLVFDEQSFEHWLPFHWKGFRQEMRYTFVINQVSPDILDQQLNRNLKRSLKLEGYKIRLTRDVSPEDFYSLCQNTYRRQNLKMPFSRAQFDTIDKAIVAHQAGLKIGELNPQGELIAVSYLLWDRERAYYFLAGDNEEGRRNGASLVLCRQALRLAFEEMNLKSFDFCGSMLESIADIRRQFGAKAVPLMKIFKAKWKWLDMVYSLTR